MINELINPNISISSKITSITHITNEMVRDCSSDDIIVKKFLKFVDCYPVIAHNAKFDVAFIKVACYRHHLGIFNNDVIDTINISLKDLLEANKHHHALYDAEGTAFAFYKMGEEINSQFVR